MHKDVIIFRPEINEFTRVFLCKTWNFCSGVDKHPKLVRYYAVLTSKQLPLNAAVTLTSHMA